MNRFIRELVGSQRAVPPEQVNRILEHMAIAPFSSRPFVVPLEERGLSAQGITLGARAPSLDYHFVKRVAEGQWAEDTTREQYLADLRSAVRSSQVRLAVYERRGAAVAAVLAPTADAVPAARRGRNALPHLWMIYAADWGTITTGLSGH